MLGIENFCDNFTDNGVLVCVVQPCTCKNIVLYKIVPITRAVNCSHQTQLNVPQQMTT